MTNTLKNIITATAIGLASLSTSEKAEAQGQTGGNIEYIASNKSDNSYFRANAFYTLPGDVKGFTFLEFYKKNQDGSKGYFGKTTLDKKLTQSGFGVRGIVSHANEPQTQVGLGVTQVVPHMPRGVFVKLGLEPIWIGPKGFPEPKTLAQYFISFPLSTKMGVSSFGDVNLITDSGHSEWSYGEIALNRNLSKNVSIKYNPALLNKGSVVPKMEHRITAEVKFGGAK